MTPDLLAVLGTGSGVFGATLAFFWKLEDIASPQAKQDIADWLKRLDFPASLSRWPDQFAELFDRLFGRRYLSLNFFLRSCLASLAAVAIVSLLCVTFDPVWFQLNDIWPNFVVGVTLLNFLPDYLSLVKSRFIITWLGKKRNPIYIAVLLTLDVIACAALFAIGFILVAVIPAAVEDVFAAQNQYSLGIKDEAFRALGLLAEAAWLPRGGYADSANGDWPDFDFGDSFTIFFYSGLLPSVWVWLYASAAGLLRLY